MGTSEGWDSHSSWSSQVQITGDIFTGALYSLLSLASSDGLKTKLILLDCLRVLEERLGFIISL